MIHVYLCRLPETLFGVVEATFEKSTHDKVAGSIKSQDGANEISDRNALYSSFLRFSAPNDPPSREFVFSKDLVYNLEIIYLKKLSTLR